MTNSVVIAGLGEIGSVFARGFLRSGYTVHPVTRKTTMQAVADEVASPELVVIAVGEADLDDQLSKVPDVWKDRLVLLQNELLPVDWQQYDLNPTVISIWFEKKKGQDSKVIIPSPVYGKHSKHVADALASIDIATVVLDDKASLLHELVVKNVYILTTNIAGLEVGGNVGELWSDNQTIASMVAEDVIRLQEAITDESLDSTALIEAMVNAFNGDKEHMCMGRSAPMRLQRALVLAAKYDLSLPTLERISKI